MVRTLARGLAEGGVESHVATTDDNGAGRLAVRCGMPFEDQGATYWHFERQSRFYTFSWPLTTWLARNVSNYDVVHIHALSGKPLGKFDQSCFVGDAQDGTFDLRHDFLA